jgi:hypothetical protein
MISSTVPAETVATDPQALASAVGGAVARVRAGVGPGRVSVACAWERGDVASLETPVHPTKAVQTSTPAKQQLNARIMPAL